MQAWLILTVLAALAGCVAGGVLKGWKAVVAGAVSAWLGVLLWLLFNEYVLPYRGGGASMWPIAQLVAGTAAAGVSGVVAGLVSLMRAPQSGGHPGSGTHAG